MKYLKLFENFNGDDLIEDISNLDKISQIVNKDLSLISQKEFDLITNMVRNFESYGSKIDKTSGLSSKNLSSDNIESITFASPKRIDFIPNVSPSLLFSFSSNDTININKYQDDWWLFILNSSYIINKDKRGSFGNVIFLLCDTLDGLLDVYDWMIRNGYSYNPKKYLNESISDHSNDLMTRVSVDTFFEIEDEHVDDADSISQGEADYLKSKMKEAEIPYDSWGLYTRSSTKSTDTFHNAIIFRLKVRSDYRHSKHYTSILFSKYKDDFWLCEILADDGSGNDYDRMDHIILDSKDGLEELFRWLSDTKQAMYFRTEHGSEMLSRYITSQTYESIKNEEEIVKVLDSWTLSDDFIDEHRPEKFTKEEFPKIKWVVDQLIERLNNHLLEPIELSSSRLNYNSTIQENEISDDDKAKKLGGRTWDWLINVHKFEDEWWLVECYLPEVSSPEGGDHTYFVCDTNAGLLALPDFFEEYISGFLDNFKF